MCSSEGMVGVCEREMERERKKFSNEFSHCRGRRNENCDKNFEMKFSHFFPFLVELFKINPSLPSLFSTCANFLFGSYSKLEKNKCLFSTSLPLAGSQY